MRRLTRVWGSLGFIEYWGLSDCLRSEMGRGGDQKRNVLYCIVLYS